MNCYEHTLIAKQDLQKKSLEEIKTKYQSIIEQNKGKVISSFMHLNPDSKNIHLDLIINQKNLTRIIKSLKRFNWNVIETYDTSLIDNLDTRFNSFLRYLNT